MAKKNTETVERKVTMWVARETDYKELYLYTHEPIKNEIFNYFICNEGEKMRISPLLFDEVVFENSPVKMEIKMKIKKPKQY